MMNAVCLVLVATLNADSTTEWLIPFLEADFAMIEAYSVEDRWIVDQHGERSEVSHTEEYARCLMGRECGTLRIWTDEQREEGSWDPRTDGAPEIEPGYIVGWNDLDVCEKKRTGPGSYVSHELNIEEWLEAQAANSGAALALVPQTIEKHRGTAIGLVLDPGCTSGSLYGTWVGESVQTRFLERLFASNQVEWKYLEDGRRTATVRRVFERNGVTVKDVNDTFTFEGLRLLRWDSEATHHRDDGTMGVKQFSIRYDTIEFPKARPDGLLLRN